MTVEKQDQNSMYTVQTLQYFFLFQGVAIKL